MTRSLSLDELLALCEAAPETDDAYSEELWEFYFAARNALPDLIAQIRALRADNERLITEARDSQLELGDCQATLNIVRVSSNVEIDRLTAKLNEAQTRAEEAEGKIARRTEEMTGALDRAERAEAELAEIKRSRG